MRILLLGSEGQVGWELRRTLAPLGQLSALGRTELDLTNATALRAAVREGVPDVVVNAAAYTAVDKAETEQALAFAVNATAPRVLAEEVARRGALLVHYSTDYIFDGEKGGAYLEDDMPRPLNVYGASKLQGERAIVAVGCRHLILRVSWVYSLRRSNFLLTVLRLVKQRSRIRIVTDQRGTPSSAVFVAEATARALSASGRQGGAAEGVYHLATTGVATRYEFAVETARLSGTSCQVEPARSSEFPLPAQRPACSALAGERFARTFDVPLPDWRADLERCLRPLREGEFTLPA